MWSNDFWFTVRLLKKQAGVALLIIAALVLGTGISTAVFAVINAVLLRPVPVYQPERVVRIYAKVNQTGATMGISYPEYLDWKEQGRSFEAISVMRAVTFYSDVTGFPQHLKAFSISASGFQVFGISSVIGRTFSETDDREGAGHVAILSYLAWQRLYGGDPMILSRTIDLDRTAYTIIGVLQPVQINVLQYPDVWVPNAPLLDQKAMSRDIRPYFPAARLKSDVSLNQARTELEGITDRLAAQYPASNKNIGIKFIGLTELLAGADQKPLSLLFAASALIVLLMWVNIVIVLLGWTAIRRKELSVRMALGSPLWPVCRQLMLQALLLVGTGSLLSIPAAALILRFFLYRFPTALVRLQETTIDYRVVGFVLVTTLISSLVATIMPAWYVSRLNINAELKGERRGSHLPRRATVGRGLLIVLEVSLASALLLVSGLLIKSFYRAANADLGFDPRHMFSFQVSLPAHYKTADQVSFYEQLRDRLSGIPGISRSSAISSLPLTTQANAIGLEIDAPHEAGQLLVEDEAVLPRFFETLKLPLLKGRDFSEADGLQAPSVVIIDEVLAQQLWPGQNPLGKRLRLIEISGTQPPWREVVGVVHEIKHFGPEAKVRWMQVYVPAYQDPSPVMSFVMETSLPGAIVQSAAAKAVRELDPSLPIDNSQYMDSLLDSYLSGRRVSVLAAACFATLSIMLASIGIYGVIAGSVVRKHRELAIRLALGASRKRIMFAAIAGGMGSACIGVILGIALTASLTRVLSSFLFGVKPLDWAVYSSSAATVLLIALLSSSGPAKRILRVDPSEILRQ
jgi:putative ABC transport system permease protein